MLGLGVDVLLPRDVRLLLALLATAALVAVELTGRAHLLPQNRRLVPQTVMRHPVAGPLQFGFEMGTGVRTYSPAALPLATALLVSLWSGSPATALLAGLGFGLGRGLVHPFRRSDPLGWDDRLRASRRWFSRWLTAAFVTLVLVLLLT